MKFLSRMAWLFVPLLTSASLAWADPDFWKYEWPKTDFTKTSVSFVEILSGGPPKDGIPAIDNPRFISVKDAVHLKLTEPVIGVSINGDARAYPLQVLMWHEIVNDKVGGVPISVTFCPLCNASIVFDRRYRHPEKGDLILDFGTTGKLRNSDLVMYDRQTESWWQQFTGKAIVGELLGAELERLPVRIESLLKFKERHPDGKVLIPSGDIERAYGINPYEGYDKLSRPFLYSGKMPTNIAPLARVVTVGERAWSLDFLRQKKTFETEDGLIITWEKGQNSALGASEIGEGVDIGNITVQRHESGALIDVVYGVDFAFAFHAFHPDVEIVTQ
ncbi:DUF3179 domain-containing protein [Sneathiella sp. P13V-1]|uniref:DUF3179 domain-containing protein n=1 Tax=Sneathiella sp. P13V-1 TaxID=2697366 RepID=UPI0039EF444A